MNNPLLTQYHNGQLSHATLLIADSSQAQELITDFLQQLSTKATDYLIFSSDESIKIADTRNILRFANLQRTTNSPLKLIALPNAQQLTPEAANALLKILEEPPKGTYFILAARQSEAVLPTIQSRCQIIRLTNQHTTSQGDAANLPALNSLSDAFAASKELAASDQKLDQIVTGWLMALRNRATTQQRLDQQNCVLNYIEAAQTTVNRRLFLDNLLLELYNLNHE